LGQIEINISKECPSSKLLPGFDSTGIIDDKKVENWIGKMKFLD